MKLPIDTLLQGGKYKIIRFISAGGFGCTYEGYHAMLKKRVAIKEFFVKDFCNRDENTSAVTVGTTSKIALVNKLKGKFVQEAQTVSSLQHPNIVHVHDIFEENGTAYYVMDYIDGPSLSDILKRDGKMSEPKALHYIHQVSDALRYVHSKNLLHLDIKPGNIMVDEADNAILIDFGASKQYDEEAGENTSTLLGKTPGYAPLEQMGNDVVKFLPSTDIYALGATLYKLLTGVTPPSATMLASGEQLKPLPLYVSANTREAVQKAMQLNKNNRPQSIDEFLQLLDGKGNDADESTLYAEDDATVNVVAEPEVSVQPSNPSNTEQITNASNQQQSLKKPVNWKLYGGIAAAVVAVVLIAVFAMNKSTAEAAEGKNIDTVAAIKIDFCEDSAYQYCAKQCDFGPRVMNSKAHDDCRQWIADKFRSFGMEVVEQNADLTGYDGTILKSTNIIAQYNPESERRILLCAHWDARPWADNDPDEANHKTAIDAANDGASGVAVMLEIARLLQKDSLSYGVDFICFDAEDWGLPQWEEPIENSDETWALGAQYWSTHPHKEGYRANCGILLDMVGGNGAQFYFELFSKQKAETIQQVVWGAANTAGYSSYFPYKDGGYITDDHLPVNENLNIPCIDIIPYYPDCEQSSFGPTWHTVNDNMQNISKETLKAVGQTLVQVLYQQK